MSEANVSTHEDAKKERALCKTLEQKKISQSRDAVDEIKTQGKTLTTVSPFLGKDRFCKLQEI